MLIAVAVLHALKKNSTNNMSWRVSFIFKKSSRFLELNVIANYYFLKNHFWFFRHKVLTNGSFLNLNLKEGPLASSGSDDASNSSRPTTSTEDPNSDSENQNKINLRRSKSTNMQHHRGGGGGHNGGHHGGLSNQQPDLLPPPDGFDNTMPRQNIYPIGKKFMP